MSILGRIGIALLALALTLVFAIARYPWDEFAPEAERLASQAAGVTVRFGEIGVGLGELGFALQLSKVRVAWPPGDELRFDRVAVRPALSLAWLMGTPEVRVRTRGGPGDFDGVASRGGVRGGFEVAEAADLPWTTEPPLTGRLVGDLDLGFGSSSGTGAVTGDANMEGRDGTLLPPGLPVAIPFDRLEVVFTLTPTGVELRPVIVEGPLASGTVTGSIAPPGGRWTNARLDLLVELDHFDPGLAQMMTSYGMNLVPGSRLTIQGTVASPRIR